LAGKEKFFVQSFNEMKREILAAVFFCNRKEKRFADIA
jgi:hypothetical protein